MSPTQEFSVYARPGAYVRWRRQLYDFGKRLLKGGRLQPLLALARPIYLVSEPAGRLRFRMLPKRPAPVDKTEFSVLSANLCHDWPRHGRLVERLETFARLVECQQADVLLLQEIARLPGLQADEWLSDRLGMAYVYARANGHLRGIGFEEGLGIFSRFPLSAPRVRQLEKSLNPFSRRLVLGAEATTPWGRLPIFSTHLGLGIGQNSFQLEHLQRWVNQVVGNKSALVGGDLNASEKSTRIMRLQTRWVDAFRVLHGQHVDGSTHDLRWPWGSLLRRARLDYIFIKQGSVPFDIMEACHPETPQGPFSDHRAVLAVLRPTGNS